MTKLNRSIERGLDVLRVVHTSGAVSLAQLAARTDLPKPTLLRICATLEAQRWLSRRKNDGLYQIGSAFPRADGMPKLVDRLVAVSKDEIVKLSNKAGLAVDLAASIGGGQVEIVDSTRSFSDHGIFPDAVGFRPSPLFSALGLAYLNALSARSRSQALQQLAETLPRGDASALPQLPKLLQAISQKGYAARATGHWGRAVDYGALPDAIAVPIIAGTEPVGAINLVWNANDHSIEDVAERHLRNLRASARIIGEAYSSPE
ncbi:helix-turn-helix domain-containing protein [Rhodobacteraceae bacterium 10Alg 79]|uniref:Helix-turn-helix domain-containing protein n=2 Tax=Rhodalgimonas zhirmunskyi TaxID=2964767 RepID=A0AAJ1U8V9_9RHOB|nr:helix-turn-helix domain-containing protein [Rhodoalgimonas zhirmunskyi]